jgi:hypothetical protein
MFGQLLPNKNKIATVWRAIYYADLGSKLCDLNKALQICGTDRRTCSASLWAILLTYRGILQNSES